MGFALDPLTREVRISMGSGKFQAEPHALQGSKEKPQGSPMLPLRNFDESQVFAHQSSNLKNAIPQSRFK